MALLPTYVSYNFLQELTTSNIDLLDLNSINNNISKLEIVELLTNNAFINFDKTKEEVFDLLEDKECNPLLRFIATANGTKKINYCKEDFKKINAEQFSSIKKPPFAQFFLSDFYSNPAKEIEEKAGHLVHTLNNPNSYVRINQLNVEVFNKSHAIDWSFLKNYSIPHHSIVIVDPYLLSEKPNHIVELIKNFIGNKLTCKYFITLFFRDKDHSVNKKDSDRCEKIVIDRIDWLKQEFSKKIKGVELELEWIIYNKNDFHDRYIITNNFMVYTGNSFSWINENNANSSSQTNWIVVNNAKSTNSGKSHFHQVFKYIEALKKWVANKEVYSTEVIKNPILIS